LESNLTYNIGKCQIIQPKPANVNVNYLVNDKVTKK